jgi:hypothetical protein
MDSNLCVNLDVVLEFSWFGPICEKIIKMLNKGKFMKGKAIHQQTRSKKQSKRTASNNLEPKAPQVPQPGTNAQNQFR